MFYYFWKKKTLKKFASYREKILSLEKENALLTDKKLQKKFASYREKINQTDKKKERQKLLDKYLIPVFALAREAIRRKIGLLLFPTQVFGAIVLHYSNIAQMNTGEGKTLTALLTVCLNALAGRSVFVITVNEYLAQRDLNLAKPIFDFLNISSGVNLTNLNGDEKRYLYENNTVIYSTGAELIFDYLRKNLQEKKQEGEKDYDYYYAVVDEVDQLLLNNAVDPFLISKRVAGGENITEKEYESSTKLAEKLLEKKDYFVDEKEKDLWLTKKGVKESESFYNLEESLFSFKNHRYNFLLHNSLKVKHFYHKNIDYIVDEQKKKIVLIDALTGRLASNRVYGSGIHQAIESKERLIVSPKNRTIASITCQFFFKLFDKLAGMTGTAKGEEEEFRQVYGMEIIKVPTYKKLIREDRDDLIYLDEKSKIEAIIDRIKKERQKNQRPILVGSPNAEVSEKISYLLDKEKVPHEMLDAKNYEKEAEKIAKAGQEGKIMVSTQANRGTDIILSEQSRKSGGLLVIGVERNSVRRVDDQLKGRAGRQGDPGESQFYVSLEDEIMKNFEMKKKIGAFLNKKQLNEMFKKPLSGKIFNYLVSEPQEVLKNSYSANRQNTLNYDLFINKQRKFIYKYRWHILDAKNFSDLNKLINKKNKMKVEKIFNQIELENLKINLVREINNFWSYYLDILGEIRALINVKVFLPQNPQEAFFWENISLFQESIKQLNNKLNSIMEDSIRF